jgi:hypothetical protein
MLTRRRLIQYFCLASFPGASFAGFNLPSRFGPVDRLDPKAQRLFQSLSQCFDCECLLNLGKAHFKSFKDAHSATEALSRYVDNNLTGIETLSPEELHEYLSLRMKKDFMEDRVKSIDGWLLSETELNLFGWLYVSLNFRRRY